MTDRGLRHGDVVQIRSAQEILATLDADGTLNGMPFMPEMVRYCGRQLTVDRRAEKVCDTVTSNLQSRRVADTVLLDDLRCDGSGHGGCQAECRLYWNEAWLRRADSRDAPAVEKADDEVTDRLRLVAEQNATRAVDGQPRYRCQATELVAASSSLSTTDIGPYVRELTSRNVTPRAFVRVMSRAVVMQPLQHLGRLPSPPLKGAASASPRLPPLDLQPGEWVRVKSREQIREMLNDKGFNRGLWFDREMAAFCGQTFQVRGRVERIVNESTGEMIELKSDCIKLEGAVCSGELSTGRWFCPREIYAYWRECWLERVSAPKPTPDWTSTDS